MKANEARKITEAAKLGLLSSEHCEMLIKAAAFLKASFVELPAEPSAEARRWLDEEQFHFSPKTRIVSW